jgi:hypothetical protein
MFAIILLLPGCGKKEGPIKFTKGTFPTDTVIALEGLNSAYNDYNSNLYVLGSLLPIIFSSDRNSSGGNFDLVAGSLGVYFDQTNGNFRVEGDMETTPFFTSLVAKANSSANEFGPYSIYSSTDGYEYLFYSSDESGGQLDIKYIKYIPPYGNNIPDFLGPFSATKLNTSSNDSYISFDLKEDSAYFSSDRSGNYDIYGSLRKDTIWVVKLDNWLQEPFKQSFKPDSVNSTADDKCPFVYKNVMVFASNRAGGLGGYDLYYSIFRHGKWSSPVNFGPGINTSSDEFRPLIGYHPEYTNNMMIFSSNRPGGAGGFDLYFTGFKFPK